MQAARALEGYEECLLQCIAIASSLYADAQDDDAEEVQPPLPRSSKAQDCRGRRFCLRQFHACLVFAPELPTPGRKPLS